MNQVDTEKGILDGPICHLESPSRQFERRDATEEEILSCRHVPDQLHAAVWIALLVGAAERFAFYCITAPWRALGLGQVTATNIYNGYYLFAALASTPIGVLSDAKLGRFRTLTMSLIFVMLFTSLPPALDHGAGVSGIAIAMIFIGIGVGGIKATVNAFIGEFGKNGRFKTVSSWPRSLTPPLGDQYENTSFQVMMTGKGEMVVVDRTLTMQYIYNIFYW
ncbi:oligopeptide transporter protein [Rutstroemia sp. NJR-2017a BBW]|nr:oligopeptide transporter protein [Rutstroemia sp. NJR-2017a BBW]